VSASSDLRLLGGHDDHLDLVARNVSTRYAAIVVDGVIGLLLLPYNIAHLGPAAYGLWALMASVTVHFSVLDLGYGGALVRFVAQYRAWRDRTALNEILSTMGVVFTAVGVATFLVTLVLAAYLPVVFNVTPAQVETGRQVLLMIGGFIALRFAVSIFGAVVYGFQRFYLNNFVGIASSVAVAAVNLAVLHAGYGLVELVAATTLVRVLSLAAYVWTALRVYPGLQISLGLFRRARLREVTGFSVYMLILDWSIRLNFSAQTLVIGAILSTAAVAVWTVGQRIADLAMQVTNQLNDALFPMVVDSGAVERQDRLQLILQQGTRLSLALAMPVCVGIIIVADRLIEAWVGPEFTDSVFVTRVLLAAVLCRVGAASASLILKGATHPRFNALVNAATAVVNVALSVAVIGRFGLPGVAVATFVPVAGAAAFVLFPAACRRVGLPLEVAVRRAIWPAAWPAVVFGALLWWTRGITPAGLLPTACQLVICGLVYEVLFFGFAISRGERAFYRTKVRQLLGRYRHLAVAA
jgi:O-antigen/teichoic acid export membrane protein